MIDRYPVLMSAGLTWSSERIDVRGEKSRPEPGWMCSEMFVETIVEQWEEKGCKEKHVTLSGYPCDVLAIHIFNCTHFCYSRINVVLKETPESPSIQPAIHDSKSTIAWMAVTCGTDSSKYRNITDHPKDQTGCGHMLTDMQWFGGHKRLCGGMPVSPTNTMKSDAHSPASRCRRWRWARPRRTGQWLLCRWGSQSPHWLCHLSLVIKK